MKLMVGLGNPGKKYENTRHNAGYRAAELLEKSKKRDLIAAKTGSFMNVSGKPVKKLAERLKIKADDLVVAHDDIDLPLGQFKIQKGRGPAGHKGVQSVIDKLGTRDFWRLRIGIRPQRGKPKNVESFVLKKFSKSEEESVDKAIKEALEKI